MSDNKILFAGPPGVGVTTAIKSISDITPIIKNQTFNDDSGNSVTVDVDYGVLKLSTGDEIYLYSTPDREVLKQTNSQVENGCIGIILLINNAEADPINNMLKYIDDYKTLIDKQSVAVAITRYDDAPHPDISDYHVALKEKKLNIPVFSVDVHEKNDIITLVKAMLYNLDSGVD